MELIILVALSILLLPLAEFTTGPLRVVLGLAFILFIPGYTLTAALFPQKGGLDGIQRLALSFGFSIVVVPLIGLTLNYSPWGVRLHPLLILLLIFVIIMASIAWFRRRQLPSEERFNPKVRSYVVFLFQWWGLRTRWDKLLSILLVVFVLGIIGTVAFVIDRPRTGEKFTEFYILGSAGKAENYPKQLSLTEKAQVIVGVVNHETNMVRYKLEVRQGQVILAQFDGIALDNDKKWEEVVEFTLPTATGKQKVDFLLYRDGEQPYRSLNLWVEVK